MKDGIYHNLTINAYHKNDTHISSTNFRKARRSLKEFKWYQDHKDQERKIHFDFGNAFELALLDPTGYEKEVAMYELEKWEREALKEKPDLISPRNGKYFQEKYKEFKTKNFEKYLINDTGKESFETIAMMLESCYQDQYIMKLLKNIEYQDSIFWTDKTTGLKLKTRPDVSKFSKAKDGKDYFAIVDVKTAIDGSPEGFSKSLANNDYPFQATMQIDGVISSGYMPRVDAYYWLVVEKNPPYAATIYQFADADRDYCWTEYEYVKGIISQAQKQNLYPGYTQRADNKYGFLEAQIPLWYKTV